jgi:competence protein ComEA
LADLLQPMPVRSWLDRLAAVRDLRWSRPLVAGAGALLAVAVLVVVGLAFLGSASPAPKLTLPRADAGSAPTDGSDAGHPPAAAAPAGGPTAPSAATPAGAQTTPPAAPPVTVVVYVAGQVASPGVYAVASGGRVADAVLAAGGTSPEADVEQLNLAARVADGERIYVPRKGEAAPLVGAAPAPPGAGAAPAGPVDLNTATAEQLEALPGVGPATSKAILAYRTSHGRFRSVTELLEVPGIGPAKLEALRPMVRV